MSEGRLRRSSKGSKEDADVDARGFVLGEAPPKGIPETLESLARFPIPVGIQPGGRKKESSRVENVVTTVLVIAFHQSSIINNHLRSLIITNS